MGSMSRTHFTPTFSHRVWKTSLFTSFSTGIALRSVLARKGRSLSKVPVGGLPCLGCREGCTGRGCTCPSFSSS